MMLGDRCLSPALLQAIPIAASISDLTLAALNPAEKIDLKFLLKKILGHPLRLESFAA